MFTIKSSFSTFRRLCRFLSLKSSVLFYFFFSPSFLASLDKSEELKNQEDSSTKKQPKKRKPKTAPKKTKTKAESKTDKNEANDGEKLEDDDENRKRIDSGERSLVIGINFMFV